MPVPDRPAEASAVLRLSGRPLQSADDVANYLGPPIGKMLWTLYRAPDDQRYTPFRDPQALRRHAADPLADRPRPRIADRAARRLQALYNAHPSAHGFIDERSIASNAPSTPASAGSSMSTWRTSSRPSISAACAASSWRRRSNWARRPRPCSRRSSPIATACRRARRPRPCSPISSPPLSTGACRGWRARTSSPTRAMPTTSPSRPTCRSFRPRLPFATDRGRRLQGRGRRGAAAGDPRQRLLRSTASKVRIQGRGVHQSVTGLCVNKRVNVERLRVRQHPRHAARVGEVRHRQAAAEHF